MSATPPAAAEPPGLAPGAPAAGARRPAILSRLKPADAGILLVAALWMVLTTHRLAQNGFANIYYSAGVRSMLHSLHNLFYLSYDQGGLISVDKPPLGLWLQVLSAKLFGFEPLSLLLPEAICGLVAVLVMYTMLRGRVGSAAALGAALALAVFPSFVAVSRDNGVDPLLLALLVLACWAALRACETGSWWALLASAVLVGLAFNTKTLAAYLAVPGIVAGYAVCAPSSLRRRIGGLMLAGSVMLAVSFGWILYVDSVAAAQRPWVGGTTDNNELGLTFNYNGLGRVEGQVGGPGQVPTKPGAYVPIPHVRRGAGLGHPPLAATVRLKGAAPKPPPGPAPTGGREPRPIPFGKSPGPLRLFRFGLGDQAAWFLPYALVGLVGFALLLGPGLLARARSGAGAEEHRRARRDPRLAALLVLGGWFLVEAVVLSGSKGIVHPYYVSALAPGAAAMAAVGALAFAKLAEGPRRVLGIVLALVAIAATIAVQIVLMHQQRYMEWFIPFLIAGGAVSWVVLALSRRLAAPAAAVSFLVMLATPAAYASTSWLAPVEGTFPVAGPRHNAGEGGYGVSPRYVTIDRALIDYVRVHRPSRRWPLLTVASEQAAPMILMGFPAAALAGYSGTDPALTGASLAGLIERGEARWVLLGGAYAQRGGNGATVAVLHVCRALTPKQWHSPSSYTGGVTLFDCAGRTRQLASYTPPPGYSSSATAAGGAG
ncbi:MAG TPA: glycosyltransferase family 39 protein [Solirubrobacteraceae bacterium]|nr:glycosyltransferase family 39 protein [Solirubrobacteraceae bacterium]